MLGLSWFERKICDEPVLISYTLLVWTLFGKNAHAITATRQKKMHSLIVQIKEIHIPCMYEFDKYKE